MSSARRCQSAHARFTDNVLYDAMHIVTKCLCPTSTDYLPILAGIQPAEFRRQEATLSLAHHSVMDCDRSQLSAILMVGPNPDLGKRIRPRHYLVPAASKLLSELSEMSIRAAQWIVNVDVNKDCKRGALDRTAAI